MSHRSTPWRPVIVLSLIFFLFSCAAKQPLPGTGEPARPREIESYTIPAPQPRKAGTEVRALWVTRFQLASPESVEQAVRTASANGFNTIFAQVRGRGDAFYASSIEPRADLLSAQPTAFDPLALLVAKAHERGIAVHAWINSFYVASLKYPSTDPRQVVNAHPERLMVPAEAARALYGMDPHNPAYLAEIIRVSKKNPRELEGLYTSPSDPEVIRDLVGVCAEIAVKYQVDGVHLDFIRYPNAEFDYSRTALDAFRAWLALNGTAADQVLTAGAEPVALPGLLPERWNDFRRAQITNAVAAVRKGVKGVRPDLTLSAAVFADATDARNRRFQDWPAWAASGLLDAVCPMAYTQDTAKFATQVNAARALTQGRALWAGIGAWKIPADSTLDKIQSARTAGADGFILFSYDEFAKPGAQSYLETVGQGMLATRPSAARQEPVR